jgi:Ca2+-binding RTX toxin-like protein
MIGGAGDDIYVLDAAGDRVFEYAGEGVDTVMSPFSYALIDEFENLTLTGSDAIDGTGNLQDNRIVGNIAANTLDGGWGNDWLAGGSGDDTYVVDSTRDAVVEAPGEGHDLVLAADSFTLGANVESLTLTGAGWIDGTGNELDNPITGNDGPNRLDGGAGADTLRGGPGDDVYVVDSTADVVIENAGEGTDAVEAAFSYTLGANLEQLRLLGSAALDATGNGAANTLVGNVGNNRLDGAAGADVMRGGAGNDLYIVDNAGDLAVENANEGVDTVQSAISFVLSANVENLLLTGTSAINGAGNALANTITGNVAANRLDGGAGADTLIGRAGNDVYIVDNAGDVVSESIAEGTDLVQASVSFVLGTNVENLTLTGSAAINGTGNALANVLTGNTANNRLDGGLGADTMSGGTGNDTYVVDQSGDIVTEGASAGIDTIEAGVNWSLGANVENLTLTGTAAINGTGNALANVLAGNAGANRLDGAAGADTMKGGAGDDVYIVDNVADITTEAAGAGNDSVQASVSWTLAANTENLALTGAAAINGTGSALGNALLGNDAANALDGGDGADLLWGAAGNDALQGGLGNDVLQGGPGDDTLADIYGNALLDGGAGADVLTGGAGRDIFIGGAGADTITTGGGADIVAFNRGGGADAVNASTGSDDTLSLGGGIAYADLRLRKSGLDLVLDAGAGDQITLRNWYQTGVNNKSVVNLQMVADAMAGFNVAGADRLLNKRVTNFNFAGIVGRFDAALAANPALTSFDVSSALGEFYLSGSDSAAIGGDLAYDYGHRNALTDIGMTAAQTVLGSAAFGASAQSLQATGVLYSGGQRLR